MDLEAVPAEPAKLDSVSLFDELADRFDQLVPMFATFGVALVDLMRIGPAMSVLDVGCGRGAVALAARARGAEVVAVEASPRMIAALTRSDAGIDARVMDAHALELSTGSIDVAIASFVIHVVDRPEQVIAEMRRVLRPGGYLALTFPGQMFEDRREDLYRDIYPQFTPRPDAPAVARETDVAALLFAAALDDIRAESIDVDLPLESPQQLWDFQMSHGFAGYVRSLEPEDQLEFEHQALRVLPDGDGQLRHRRRAVVHLARKPLTG